MSVTTIDSLVFIACARADLSRVEPIVSALRALGHRLYFEPTLAAGAGNSVRDGQQALRDATVLVVFVSAASAQSPWVEEEVRAFQTLRAVNPERVTIPVLLDTTPLPHALAAHAAIAGQSASPAQLAAAISQILKSAARQELPALEEYSPEPTYSLQTVGSLVQVRPLTLWSWEQLLGMTHASPTQGEQEQPRVYSARDVAAFEWVRDRVVAGESVKSATDRLLAVYTFGAAMLDSQSIGPDEPEGVRSLPAEVAPEEEPPLASPPPAPAPKPSLPPAPQPAPRPSTGPGASSVAPSDIRPDMRNTGTFPSIGAVNPRAKTPLEQVTFTAYHPREVQPHQWQPMVVYLSLDNPASMAQVAAFAAERLAGRLNTYRSARAEQSAGLARGAALRIVPSVPGVQFNPSHLDITWQEDVQQHEFRMRAEGAKSGQAVNGVVQFYQGILLRAEVPISVFVGQAAARLDSPDAFQQAVARAYRRIFASYSHQDTPVVESCETAARSMGDQYLRDVTLLQAGVQWDPRLIQAINDADIFQLFWSKRAAASPFVQREWQHALMLLPVRPNFIRPVYWSRELYPTPPELTALHFQPLSLSNLGWGPVRSLLFGLRNR